MNVLPRNTRLYRNAVWARGRMETKYYYNNRKKQVKREGDGKHQGLEVAVQEDKGWKQERTIRGIVTRCDRGIEKMCIANEGRKGKGGCQRYGWRVI